MEAYLVNLKPTLNNMFKKSFLFNHDFTPINQVFLMNQEIDHRTICVSHISFTNIIKPIFGNHHQTLQVFALKSKSMKGSYYTFINAKKSLCFNLKPNNTQHLLCQKCYVRKLTLISYPSLKRLSHLKGLLCQQRNSCNSFFKVEKVAYSSKIC